MNLRFVTSSDFGKEIWIFHHTEMEIETCGLVLLLLISRL